MKGPLYRFLAKNDFYIGLKFNHNFSNVFEIFGICFGYAQNVFVKIIFFY